MVSALFGDAEGADDFSFLAHVVEQTKSNYNIDGGRVYGTGHSNGCAMTAVNADSLERTVAYWTRSNGVAESMTASLQKRGRQVRRRVLFDRKRSPACGVHGSCQLSPCLFPRRKLENLG